MAKKLLISNNSLLTAKPLKEGLVGHLEAKGQTHSAVWQAKLGGNHGRIYGCGASEGLKNDRFVTNGGTSAKIEWALQNTQSIIICMDNIGTQQGVIDKYLLDQRPHSGGFVKFTNYYLANGSIEPLQYVVDDSGVRLANSWDSVPENAKLIYLNFPSAITQSITLFNDYTSTNGIRGSFVAVLAYNRRLSFSEIQQNYEYVKSLLY